MNNRINVPAEESANIILKPEREPDGRVKITTIIADIAEMFVKSIDVQEPEERSAYVSELCADKPGIGTDDRRWIRNELQRIARATRIDLRFEPCGHVNGSIPYSVTLWSGSKPVETTKLNFRLSSSRRAAIEHFIPYVAGRNASKRKQDQARRDLEKIFGSELTRVLTTPPPRPTFNRADDAPYRYDDTGIVLVKKSSFGEQVVPITDFIARIVAEVSRDDGSSRPTIEFEIEATAAGRQFRLTVPANEFEQMNWTISRLGTAGVIRPAQKEHARAAILMLNPSPTLKSVYTHTGWRQLPEGGWGYLHADGMITAEGQASIEVSLDGPLEKYRLPVPPTGAELARCVRASLKVLELAPSEITTPPYCAVWRSVLGRTDTTVSLIGPSGAGKSELAALAVQHFGREMTRLALPFHFASTQNALGEGMYLAKDALLPADDYKLLGGKGDDKIKAAADGLIQGAGNGGGRNRMRAEGGLRDSRPPRATLLITGEQVPGTRSCRARQVICEVGPSDIDFARLTDCQRDAIEGRYAGAMAAYLQWLATNNRIEQVRKDLEDLVPALRAKATASPAHKRIPANAANLHAGLLYFLEFAVEKGIITAAERSRLEIAAWEALGRQGLRQRKYQEESDPAARYIELLESAISSGEAHIAGPDGEQPAEEIAAACGWWKALGGWQRQGVLVGYWITEGIALLADAAYKAVQRAAGRDEAPVGSERDLRQRLMERGLLVVAAAGEDELQRLTVQRRVGGKKRNVLLLRHEALNLSGGAYPSFCARTVRTTDSAADENLVFGPETGVES